jgi:hypothetical protein
MLDNPINSKTLEAIVYKILAIYKEARNSDFVLITKVIEDIGIVDIRKIKFIDLMRKHDELMIPSFESITRARRKIQAKELWLRADDDVAEQRRIEEENFKQEYGKQ